MHSFTFVHGPDTMQDAGPCGVGQTGSLPGRSCPSEREADGKGEGGRGGSRKGTVKESMKRRWDGGGRDRGPHGLVCTRGAGRRRLGVAQGQPCPMPQRDPGWLPTVLLTAGHLMGLWENPAHTLPQVPATAP